jgi:uncharacterized membrane protein YfcA
VISVAASISFLLTVGTSHLAAVAGLIIGGVLAAPFGALFIRRIPSPLATTLAGLAVIALGTSNLIHLL